VEHFERSVSAWPPTRANLDDPNKPQGVFLFVGPSDVGKTETALALADGTLMQACLNKTPEELPAAEELEALIRPALVKQFKPAFLGRLKVVPFYPIPDDVLADIIELKLGRIGRRVAANHKAAFAYDEPLVDAVLARMAEVATIERIAVGADGNGDFTYAVA
jgi:type VI secretion system protein VasG